ncbi:MAG TPA: helix-turn-helix transcriptional regulator [Candidatus Tumulicola sp.]|jgi:transcriptional regulator with XRE-family HTH domain
MGAVAQVRHRDRAAGAILDAIRETLGLSETELADLFGVRAPSIAGWRDHGIPPARRASVERLADLARVLRREVKPSRIPQVVRTPDAWLEGRTMLEVVREAGPEPIYAYLHRLFSYDGV